MNAECKITAAATHALFSLSAADAQVQCLCLPFSHFPPHSHTHTNRDTHAYMTNQNKVSNIKTTTHASFTLRGISYEFRENNI